MKPKFSQIKKSHTLLAAGLLTASFVVTPSVQAANWAGGAGNWSSNTSPGWNGSGVPNEVGAVARTGSGNSTITQDISGGVTVGTISQSNTGGTQLTITNSNGITLDQDGSGTGTARILNANTNPTTSGNNFLRITGGTLTLADNLLISNTANNNTTVSNGGAISINAAIAGTGNITIDNVMNNTSTGAGCIRLWLASTYTGTVNVRSGMTVISSNTALGDVSNTITLGASGAGSASLLSNGASNVAHNWVVAAESGGTLTLGSLEPNARTFSGNGTLNGNLTLLTAATPANTFSLTGVISGTGNVTMSSIAAGAGAAQMSNANTYSGSTTVSSGILSLSNALALQNSAVDTTASVTGTATAGLRTTVTTLTLGGLTGNKNLADVFATGTASSAGQYSTITGLTLNPGTGVTHTYSAAIANGAVAGMSLTKSGLGTQVLSGTNTYTGATTVTQGTLVVNGNISTGLVTVGASGTLGGTGTVGGATTVNGTLAVGTSPGTMTFTNTLGLNGTTVMEIDGTAGAGVDPNGHDFINLTGAGAAGVLTYGGTMTLDIGTTFGNGTYLWNLFDFASETGGFTSITLDDEYSGSLSESTLGSGVWGLTSGSNTWQFTESTGVLGLTVNVIPEPGAALLGSLGMLMLLRRRR